MSDPSCMSHVMSPFSFPSSVEELVLKVHVGLSGTKCMTVALPLPVAIQVASSNCHILSLTVGKGGKDTTLLSSHGTGAPKLCSRPSAAYG